MVGQTQSHVHTGIRLGRCVPAKLIEEIQETSLGRPLPR
ncbi:hypothetical protein chiPu_0032470, partial [Chiloscyllium punctatum]|nr:hypothetical protein [Chiloscyllium punctatum]